MEFFNGDFQAISKVNKKGLSTLVHCRHFDCLKAVIEKFDISKDVIFKACCVGLIIRYRHFDEEDYSGGKRVSMLEYLINKYSLTQEEIFFSKTRETKVYIGFKFYDINCNVCHWSDLFKPAKNFSVVVYLHKKRILTQELCQKFYDKLTYYPCCKISQYLGEVIGIKISLKYNRSGGYYQDYFDYIEELKKRENGHKVWFKKIKTVNEEMELTPFMWV